MALIYGFGNYLFIIYIISIFVHTQAADDYGPTIADIKDSISKECNQVEDIPQEICDKILDPLQTRIKGGCRSIVNTLCNDMPWSCRFLISANSCEEELSSHVCGNIDEALTYADSECVEELQKIVIGQGCNANGTKTNICNGLLTTPEGICTAVVDFMCGELPWILNPIIPYCQEILAKHICSEL